MRHPLRMTKRTGYVVSRVSALAAQGWASSRIDALPRSADFAGLRIVEPVESLLPRDARILEAIAAAPAGGVLSGWAAAAWHGVPDSFLDGTADGTKRRQVEFCVSRDEGIYRRSGLRVRYSKVPTEDIVELNGIEVTSRRRTTLDLARWAKSEGRALAMLDLAMRHGLVGPEFADYARPLKGLHGLKRVRAVMGEMCAEAESVPESELRWTWLCTDLPRPTPNVRVYDRFGQFVGRIDLFDATTGLGAEYQGFWHHRDGAPQEDAQRFDKFAAMNMNIVPVWKEDVAEGSVSSLLHTAHRRAQQRDPRLDSWSILRRVTHEPPWLDSP